VLLTAIRWIEHTLLGSAATAVATLAIASVGLLLLTGRIDVRRGLEVVLGCFMIFGAASIASGIISAMESGGVAPQIETAEPLPPVMPKPPMQNATATYDPYAGAAVAPH
jgi:hypothetical protein